MMRGFLAGMVSGATVSVMGAAGLSLLAPQPAGMSSPQAPQTALTVPQAAQRDSAPRNPQIGSGTMPVLEGGGALGHAGQDTETALDISDAVPEAPDAGQGLLDDVSSPEIAGAMRAPDQDLPVVIAQQTAEPRQPASEAALALSEEPAQPEKPASEGLTALGETVVSEAAQTAINDADNTGAAEIAVEADLVEAQDTQSAEAAYVADIRTYFDRVSADWSPLPPMVIKTFAASEDPEFFNKPAHISSLTRHIGKWFVRPNADVTDPWQQAFAIGEALSQGEIVSLYAQQVYLGQQCYGVTAAGRVFFGREVVDLSLQDIAYLAARAKSPVAFDPSRAIARRNAVIDAMVRAGAVSEDAAKVARAAPITLQEPLGLCDAED